MIVRAKYENGMFRPIGSVPKLKEGTSVVLSVRKPLNLKAIRKFRGTLSKNESEEIRRLIREGRRVEGNW
jgi:predicted DNA-binding antitoxin AbrB/MazE fold protein